MKTVDVSIAVYNKGRLRSDIKDFASKAFELQLKVDGEWKTHDAFSPFTVEGEWAHYKQRWPNIRMRLRMNGRTIRVN